MAIPKETLEKILESGNLMIISNSASFTNLLLKACKEIHEEKNHRLIFIEEENTFIKQLNTPHTFLSIDFLKQNFMYESLIKKDPKYDHILLNCFTKDITLTSLNAFILYEKGNVGVVQADTIDSAIQKLVFFNFHNCQRRESSEALLYSLINLTFHHIILLNNDGNMELYKFHESDVAQAKNYSKFLKQIL